MRSQICTVSTREWSITPKSLFVVAFGLSPVECEQRLLAIEFGREFGLPHMGIHEGTDRYLFGEGTTIDTLSR
jgi:hypothetical protein